MKAHTPRRRFGQNFLKNKSILKEICQSLPIISENQAAILEIGPGQGALTDELLSVGFVVHAIEIDRDLVAYLKEKYAHKYETQFFIRENDVLNVDLRELCKEQGISHIIGNLPYNISTPFLLKFEQECPDLSATFLIQKEVAERLKAITGTKDYGRLSLAIQHSFTVTKVCDVSPENFHPAPLVQSQVVRLSPKEIRLERAPFFQKIVDTAFQKRRKTLKNALFQWSLDFSLLEIDSSRRPETLSELEFQRIALSVIPKTFE